MCDSKKKTNKTNNCYKAENSKPFNYEFIYYNDFWFNHKEYNKIENGLVLGSDSAVKDLNCMEMLEINHIITVKEEPVPEDSRFGHISYVHIEAGDFPDQDLLSSFDYCYKLISNAQKNDENVYVHCGAGVSRSATIVIAFLMKKYSISFMDAIRRVVKKRKVFPNEGFTEQLGLYERMKWFTDGYNEEYRRFTLKSLTYQLRTDRISLNTDNQYLSSKIKFRNNAERQLTLDYETNCVRSYFEKIGTAEHLSEQFGPPKDKGQLYHCYVCNTELFNQINIIGDQKAKQMARNVVLAQTRREAEPDMTSCGNIFIEPLQTYCTQSNDEKTGFLNCPNCMTVFGFYNWLLYHCECSSHRIFKECLALKVDYKKISL